jgi:hypothetical protein
MTYDPENQQAWDKSSGYVISLLHHEVRTLHDQQVTSVREGLTALKCTDAGKLAFSSYCGKCRQLVLDKCKESEVLAAFKQREMETLNNARAFVQRAAEKSAQDAEKKSGAPSSSSDAAGD